MRTGFLYDERFLQHEPGQGHPESRQRLLGAVPHLQAQPWFKDLIPIAAVEAERQWLESVHSHGYIERAQQACAAGAPFLDVSDVGISERSAEVSMLVAGGIINMVDAVVSRDIDNGFVLSRPPGHHAEKDMALGFCLFNHIAIAARYLQQRHDFDKILILDWDVHHGNGTQHTFEEDPSVLYVSTHQYPYYPGTGAYSETGIGRGEGATLNCPLPAGAGDAEHEHVWRERILPKIERFAPQMILVSAGFDGHRDDPLAQTNLSTEFYRWMTQRVMELADKHCDGRLVSILEGGYNIERLAECVSMHIGELSSNEVNSDV